MLSMLPFDCNCGKEGHKLLEKKTIILKSNNRKLVLKRNDCSRQRNDANVYFSDLGPKLSGSNAPIFEHLDVLSAFVMHTSQSVPN